MISSKKLVDEFNRNFSAPFLPDGFAKAHLDEDDNSVVIQIGPRDLHLGPNGEPFGSGSLMVPKWKIKRIENKSSRRMSVGKDDLIKPNHKGTIDPTKL